MISLLLTLIFAGAMIIASWRDLTSMTIPNMVSVVLFLSFWILAPLAGLEWKSIGMHALGGLACFAVGVVFFAVGWMGGGDVKLLGATAFWWAPTELAHYLLYTAMFGGALAVILLGARRIPASLLGGIPDWTDKLLREETNMPYGLALSASALLVFPTSEIFQSSAQLGIY